MKVSLKQTTKHFILVIAAAVIAGGSASLGVFAAIPHSVTGVISACRTNDTGAVRIIDAQAGDTCTGTETGLSWNTDDRHSALARFDVDAGDSTAIVYNASTSRNMVKADIVDNSGAKFICMEVKFAPETSTLTQGDVNGIGGGNYSVTNVRLASQGSMSTAMINYYCGAENGYNALAQYDPTLSSANAAAISFSN